MSRFKTVFPDYTLWYDGIIQIDPSQLEGLFLKGINPKHIAVTEMNPDVAKFNKLSRDKITVKDEIDAELIPFDWNIPPEYLAIDVHKYVFDKSIRKQAHYSGDELQIRYDRINMELDEYTKRDLLDILRVLIYIVDEFKKNNVVWGVGRGSSCASYILFLLEVHSIDSVKYDIPLEEFLK